jgi:hypothetical protein
MSMWKYAEEEIRERTELQTLHDLDVTPTSSKTKLGHERVAIRFGALRSCLGPPRNEFANGDAKSPSVGRVIVLVHNRVNIANAVGEQGR